jgi:hypothetical protein
MLAIRPGIELEYDLPRRVDSPCAFTSKIEYLMPIEGFYSVGTWHAGVVENQP